MITGNQRLPASMVLDGDSPGDDDADSAAAARAANRAKTMLLSHIAHDLRTPLNAVIGFANLLDDDVALAGLPVQRGQVRIIRDAGKHLLAMIEDLLDLSLAEIAHLPLHPTAVPLAPELDACVAWIRPQADAAGIALHVEPTEPAEPSTTSNLATPVAAMCADPTRLRQVLTNLLGNAVKYNRPGGRVTLRACRVAEHWRIDVEDTGTGIGPAERLRLFQPFDRLGRETSRISGTGLGLALSQLLAQRMGGRITAASTPGVGSIFSLLLPAA
jgi:signal transduction histidine kinase